MKYHYFLLVSFVYLLSSGCKQEVIDKVIETNASLVLELSSEGNALYIVNDDGRRVVTQNAQDGHRPYLHPITAPNTNIELTQYSPGHHKHQTGLYWGFTRVNGTGIDDDGLKKWFYNQEKPNEIADKIGRDFFHFPGETHWQRVSLDPLIEEGDELKWQTVYNMLDAEGNPIMKETQVWTFTCKDDQYFLSLEWTGEAIEDITINEFDYGGLFLRMPWDKDTKGEAVNAARQKNNLAEGQRAMWVDVGMEIEGLEDWGHIAIFDHPDNGGFPTPWRVDGQLGIGPVRAGLGDWHIKAGDSKTFRHQIVAYSGDLIDVKMNENWADYVGDHGMYNTASLWGIAQEEAKNAKLLSPQEAVDIMTLKDGYKANVYAAEPTITQPMAFCWDDKGRMWIAENRDYESRGFGFSKHGDSRILILEDTDKDGVVDNQKVFLEGIPFPSAIAVGFDGLYLGAPPNLLFVPDKDHDDKADVDDIEVLLTGWGIRDRHETINSFHWGPDGWLYGLEGFATPSKIRKPKGNGRIYRHKEEFPADLLDAEGVDINGGVWRYHPVKHKFEAVAHGFSNPWGIDYDSKGQLFISACVIPHLFHIIPGGIYHRQGGKHFNPYVYEDIQTIVDHRHRSAHGGARIYQSDAFGLEEQGRLFMANIHEHAVLSDVLTPKGSGFVASHGDDFMLAHNAQWIGFSMEVGPEGGLFVLDWHDADICGKEVLNKETGRVFRIMPEESLAENWEGRYDDLNTFSDLQLAQLQRSKSNWHAQRARVVLQGRAVTGSIEDEAVQHLDQILNDRSNADQRLRALWTIFITNEIDYDGLLALLDDRDPYVRSWAIQFLTEDMPANDQVISQLNEIAKNEKSPVVRRYLAGALQRLELGQRWSIASSLVGHDVDADDVNIPLMLWFAIEPLIVENPEKAMNLARGSNIPSVTNKIARRMVDGDLIDLLSKGIATADQKSKEALLEGMLAGLQGRTDLKEPDNWSDIVASSTSDKGLSELTTAISQQFGNAASAEQMLAALADQTSTAAQRNAAIQSLAEHKRTELVDMIPDLVKDPALRIAAIRAIASFNDQKLGQLLLDQYDDLNDYEQQEAIQALASRPTYGWQLAYALKDEKIARRDIPAYVALQLRRVVGNGFVEIWGPIDEISGDKKSQLLKYQRLLSDEAIANGNPSTGQTVFNRTCYTCHQMHGKGGNLGPDLTGSNRTNTAYLLSNIIEPSGELQDDYKMVVITTQDGRTYTGNITAENERQITIRTANLDAVNVNKSDIQSQEVSPKSMMPEGLFNNLTDREVVDLVAFMQVLEPL